MSDGPNESGIEYFKDGFKIYDYPYEYNQEQVEEFQTGWNFARKESLRQQEWTGSDDEE